jgi:hypothetical protein
LGETVENRGAKLLRTAFGLDVTFVGEGAIAIEADRNQEAMALFVKAVVSPRTTRLPMEIVPKRRTRREIPVSKSSSQVSKW